MSRLAQSPSRKTGSRARSKKRLSARSGWRRWLSANKRSVITLGVVALVVSLSWGNVDMEEVQRQARTVPGGVAFLLMVLLPLVGCPATLVNVGAGVRFGIAGGLPLVALAIALHQVIAFFLVRWKPGLFGHLVDPIRERLPKGSHTSLTVFTSLLPGVPYWMQLYALPLMGVRLRTLLLCAVPLHTVRSMIALVGGGISGHLTAGWLVALGIYAIVLMSVCAYVGRNIRRRVVKARSRKRAVAASSSSSPSSGTRLQAALVAGGK